MKKLYLILSLSFLAIIAYSQTDQKDYSEAFKLVEVWLDAQKDYDNLPGITAIVVEDQDVLWTGAFGLANAEKNVQAESSTICSICSISKLFTSVAIMKLYDEGKLRLDDRIGDLLPQYDLKQKFPESGPITIRSLLTHSSGLPREAAYYYWNGPDFPFPTKQQIDDKLSEQETLYPASTYYQYSNLALTLLGEIVESVSGQPFDKYIEQNILIPLRLKNTRTAPPEELYGNKMAIGYSSNERDGTRAKLSFFEAKGITPAAGFSSNVQDLGAFASWIFRLRDSKEPEILKPATLKYMQIVHWTDPDWETTSGLGFAIWQDSDGNTMVGHGGNCPGYRTALHIDLKNKRAYSVMINANGTNPWKYTNGINTILNKVESIDDETQNINLDEYVGYYNSQPWWSENYLSTWNGKLVMLELPSDKPAENMTFYKYIEGDTFRRIRDDDELGETLIFERDKNGNIVKYITHQYYSEKINR